MKRSFSASHNDSDTLRNQNALDNTLHNIVSRPQFFDSGDNLSARVHRNGSDRTGRVGPDFAMVDVCGPALGSNFNWTSANIVLSKALQLTSAGTLAGVSQIVSVGLKQRLDLYGLRKFNPNAQLHLSANNLINSDYLTGGNVIDDRDINHSPNVLTRTYSTWTLRLELKILGRWRYADSAS